MAVCSENTLSEGSSFWVAVWQSKNHRVLLWCSNWCHRGTPRWACCTLKPHRLCKCPRGDMGGQSRSTISGNNNNAERCNILLIWCTSLNRAAQIKEWEKWQAMFMQGVRVTYITTYHSERGGDHLPHIRNANWLCLSCYVSTKGCCDVILVTSLSIAQYWLVV